MKMLRVLIVLTLAAGWAFTGQSAGRAQDDPSFPIECADLASASPYTTSGTPVGSSGYFEPVTYIFTVELGTAEAATVRLTNDFLGLGDTLAGPAAVPTTLRYDMIPADRQLPMGVSLYLEVMSITPEGGTIEVTISCGAEAAVTAGCGALVDIPEQAVVGKFNWNSELYWAPGHQIMPMTYVEAGNTYYVAGQDKSEEYYKILIACEWYWVRKDTVGPNYDEVWQGQPLPTKLVE